VDKENAQTVSNLIKLLMDGVSKLSAAMAKHDFDSIEEHMQYSAQTIRPLMDKVSNMLTHWKGKWPTISGLYPPIKKCCLLNNTTARRG
jgi:glutamine synthetase type III